MPHTIARTLFGILLALLVVLSVAPSAQAGAP